MERIVYRKTLDVHKNGVQFMLQGFETADKMARKIEISLMASGDTIDFPLEQITAIMYVTTPGATEPSINACTIKDNTIIYEVLPITEEGITEMQLKLISTRPEGANGVLATPRFAVEVSKSNTDDESVTQTTTYTALEDAIAKAKGVYDSRLLRIELSTDCMFRAYYADGTIYETNILKELFHKGEALLSQSYARGGTGVRAGEDTDNSMYYSNVSRSASEDTKRINDETKDTLTEVRKHSVYTTFSVDFTTGEVKYISPNYKFNINKETGELDAEGESFIPEETIGLVVSEWLNEKTLVVDEVKNLSEKAINNSNNALTKSNNALTVSSNAQTIAEESLSVAKGKNQAHVFDTTEDLYAWLSSPQNAGKYQVGDNLYIVDTEVPDWWISEVLTEADEETGYYYKIAQLETQKVDLTNLMDRITVNENSISTIQNQIGKKWRYPEGNPSFKTVENGSYAIYEDTYMPIEFRNTPDKTSYFGTIIVSNNTAHPCAIIVLIDGTLWVYNDNTNLFEKK